MAVKAKEETKVVTVDVGITRNIPNINTVGTMSPIIMGNLVILNVVSQETTTKLVR